MPVDLTISNHDTVINGNNVLIIFSAKWCAPCKRMKPDFINVEENTDAKKLTFAIVDVDISSDIAVKYNVSNLPTLVLIKNGNVIETRKGVMTQSKIVELIDNNLSD